MHRLLLFFTIIIAISFFSFTPREGGNEESYAIEQEALTMLESMPIDETTAASTIVNTDLFVLVSLLVLSLASLGFIRSKRVSKASRKVTKWAQKHPQKAQWMIAGLQVPSMAVAVLGGYSLAQMDIHLSTYWHHIATVATIAGFLGTPLLFQKQSIILPKQLASRQAKYFMISVATILNFSVFGNHLDRSLPNSPLTKIVHQVDQSIFPTETATLDLPIQPAKKKAKASKKQKKKPSRFHKYRPQITIGAYFALFFIILIICTALCAGICLIGFAAAGDIAAGYLVLGIALLVGSIIGIVFTSRWFRKLKRQDEINLRNLSQEEYQTGINKREKNRGILYLVLGILGIAYAIFYFLAAAYLQGLSIALLSIGAIVWGIIKIKNATAEQNLHNPNSESDIIE